MLSRLFKTETDIRKYQINTLMIFNDNVTEVTAGEEYEVSFNSGETKFCLRVVLSREFPNEKPKLQIVPPVVHHWVNSDGIVTDAPGLLNFSVHSSDLGRVVQAVIREFQRTPPPVISSSNTSPTVPINGEIQSSTTGYQVLPSNIPKSTYFPPTVVFPELVELSLQELMFLNENVDRQDEFIRDLSFIRDQNTALDDLISQIEELAESNISKEDKLVQLKKDVDSRVVEVTKLAFENERLHVKYQNYSDKYTPRNIKEQLRIAAMKADSDSEKVAEAFLGGEIDVDKFITDFIKIKMLSQTRKTKEEKLGQQLDKLERAGF